MIHIRKLLGYDPPVKSNSGKGEAPAVAHDPWEPDQPLFYLSPHDPWTPRMAYSGTAIFGETGSGKTSGSGALWAKSFLRAGMGGLVLCPKSTDKNEWIQWAKETGREEHLIIFGEGEPWRCNFLKYEQHRKDGGGQVENLVELLMKASEFSGGRQSTGGDGDFFERASREMLRAAFSALLIAQEPISLEAISRMINEAPQSLEEAASEAWKKSSYTADILSRGAQHLTDARSQHGWEVSGRYWMISFPALADRTRSSILATYSSVADSLNHGIAWELFGTDINIVPEVTYKQGAIIILDLPLARYHAVGRLCQALFKYLFQRALLQRDTSVDPRPVFLFCDEAQLFVSPNTDFAFQTVARSSRVCTVMLSQNTSGYYAALQGSGRDEIDAILGNLTTKVFHAQSNANTNQYAADLIGKRWRTVHNYSTSHSIVNTPSSGSSSAGGAMQLVHAVEPAQFTRLRKGGPDNNLEVDAVVYQGGRTWQATGETYMHTTFKQS